jgi:hypothetical protein
MVKGLTRLHIKFRFDFPARIGLASENLDTAVLNERERRIEISPPRSYVKSDQSEAQAIEICIIEDVDLQTMTLEEINNAYSTIAESYFLKTRELVRLHTRRYNLGYPQLGTMKQDASSIYDTEGRQLYFMNNIAIGLVPVDKHIYPLDSGIWRKVVEYLVNGREPDLYLLLLMDGKYYAVAGRVREAIIMLAVGIEQFTVDYLNRDKYEEEKDEVKFADFFDEVVAKAKGRSLKKERNDDYHRVNYLFAIRNNIAHGKGCYFKIGKNEKAVMKRVLGSYEISESDKVEINQYMARALSDHVIALIDWIKECGGTF